MKKNVPGFKLLVKTCLMGLLIAGLAACGNSGKTDTTPVYTGITDPAPITTDNADEIAAKAIGAGLISGLEDPSDAKAVKLSKLLADSDASMSKGFSKSSEAIINDLYDGILEGDLLPDNLFDSKDLDTFPNVSGTYATTVTTTDSKTFTVTHVFTQAVHSSGLTAADISDNTLNGTAVEVLTYSYTDGAFTWTDETPAEKLELIRASYNETERTMTCKGFTHQGIRYYSPDILTYNADTLRYDTYNEVQDYSYVLDGTYSVSESGEPVFIKGMDPSSEWDLKAIFKGSISITDHYTSVTDQEETKTAFVLKNGEFSKKISEKREIVEADGLITEYWNAFDADMDFLFFSFPDGDMEVSLKGDLSVTSETSEDGDTGKTTLSFSNAGNNMLMISKTALNSLTEGVNRSRDYSMNVAVAGNANLEHTTGTETSDGLVSKTLTMAITAGKLSVSNDSLSNTDYTVVDAVSHTHETGSTSYKVAVSGSVRFSMADEFFTFSGALNVDTTSDSESYDSTLDKRVSTMSINLDNTRLVSNDFDVTFHGTITSTSDYSEITSQGLTELDLLLRDGVKNKTYHFSDYTFESQLRDIRDKKVALDSRIALSGRFYHPDFGYVDVSTSHFDLLEMCEPSMMIRYLLGRPNAIYPTAGTLFFSGAKNSKTQLTVFTGETFETSGYIITADANGDGIFEVGPIENNWTDIEGLMDDFWLAEIFGFIGK